MNQLKKISKKKRTEPLLDIETLQKLAKQASRRAIKYAENSGVSAVFVKDGKLVKRNPDHSITELKKMADKPRLRIEDIFCQA